MKIAVYETSHEIADRVARSLARGLNSYLIGKSTDPFPYADIHIAYGILRGTADIFKKANCWFNVDRGYWRPSHYDGYYRISLRETQQTKFWPEPDYERYKRLGIDIAPWRGPSPNKPVLVIPPTTAVKEFYNLKNWKHPRGIVRTKSDSTNKINFQDYSYVYTFNSSVGWQALAAGIPCISDATHSMVGSWFSTLSTTSCDLSLDELANAQYLEREKLFAVMSSLQLTLEEIEQGKLWPLMSSLISTSALMAANPLLPMSPRIQLENVPVPNPK